MFTRLISHRGNRLQNLIKLSFKQQSSFHKTKMLNIKNYYSKIFYFTSRNT